MSSNAKSRLFNHYPLGRNGPYVASDYAAARLGRRIFSSKAEYTAYVRRDYDPSGRHHLTAVADKTPVEDPYSSEVVDGKRKRADPGPCEECRKRICTRTEKQITKAIDRIVERMPTPCPSPSRLLARLQAELMAGEEPMDGEEESGEEDASDDEEGVHEGAPGTEQGMDEAEHAMDEDTSDAALTEPEVWVKVEEEDGWLTWLACYDTDGPVKEEDVEDNVGRITGAEVQFEQEEIPDVGGSQVPYEQEGTPVDGELSHADAAPEEPDAQLQADKRTGLISDPPSSLVQEEVLEDYESIAQSQEPPIHHLMSPAKARSPTLDYLPLRPSSVPEIARKSTGARKVVVPAQLDDSVMDECDFNMAPLPPAPRAPIPRAPTIRMESCSADNLACLLHLPPSSEPTAPPAPNASSVQFTALSSSAPRIRIESSSTQDLAALLRSINDTSTSPSSQPPIEDRVMGESEAAYRLGRSAAADEHMTQGENKQLILDMSRTAYRSSHSHAGDEDGVVVVQWNKPKRKPKKVQQPKLEPTEDVLPPAPPVSSAHPRTTSAASVVPFWDQVNPSAAPIVPFWDKASTSPSANEGDVAMDEPMPTSQSIRDVVMTSSATILDHDSLPMPSKAEMDTQHVPSVPPAAEENIGRCGASVKPEPISDEPLPALPSEREWVYTPTNTANLADFRDDPRATDEFLHGFDHEEGFYQEDGFYAEEPYAEQTTTFIPIPIPIVIVVPIFVDGSSTAPSSDAPGAKLEPVDDEDELTCDEEPIRAVAPRLLALPASVSHKAVATIDSVDGAHLVEGPSVSGDLLVFRDTPDMREDDSDDESDDESDSSDEESQTSLWSADRSLWSYRESTPVDFAEDDECSQGALSSSSSYASEINAGSRSCDLPPTLLWLANQWSMGNPSFNVQDRFIEQRLDVDSSIGLPPSASLESCDSFKSLASFDSFYTAIDWEDNSDSAMSTGDVSTNTTSTADDSADDSDASVYSLDAPGSIACDFDQYQCLGQFFAQFEVDMEHSAAITACPHAASIAPAAVLDREEYSPLKNLDDLRELSTTIESSSDYTRTKRKFFWNWGWLTVLVINALSCFVQSLTPTPTFNLPQHPTAISLYP